MADRTLCDLQAGESACIKSFSECYCAGKLLSMGFTPGQHLSVLRKVPFGGSLYVTFADRTLALRANEARQVTVTI